MADTEKEILLSLKINYAAIAKQIDDTKTKIGELKAQQVALNESFAAAKASGNQQELEAISAQIVQNTAETKAYTQEVKNLEKQSVLIAQANNAEAGSYEENLRLLQLKRTSLKLLEDTLERNADGTIQLTAAYVKESAEVKKLAEIQIAFDQNIKDGRTNVGNYASAFAQLTALIEPLTEKLSKTKADIDNLNDAYSIGNVTQADYTSQLTSLTSSLNENQSELTAVTVKIEELNQNSAAVGDTFKSLKTQIAEAATAAQAIGEKFGFDSVQALEAQEKVAGLKEQLSDFNDRVQALNPEAKLKVFTQAFAGIAGGISAAQGAMALFGGESDATQEALLKVKGALAFASGINQLLTLGDTFKSLKAILGLTTAATTAQTVAQEVNTTVTVAETVATTELAVAQTGAATTSTALASAIAFLTGPIGLIVIGIAAAVAAFKLYDAAQVNVIENTELLNKLASDQVEVAEQNLKSRNELVKREEDLGNSTIERLEAERKGDQEIFDQKQKNLNFIQGLQDRNYESNIENINKLTDYSTRLGAQLVASGSKDEQEKLEKTREAVDEKIELLKKANESIIDDQNAADAELENQRLQHEENLRQIANQARTIRLGLIKDDQKREIALERDSLQSKLDAVRGNTEEEIALRTALEAQTSQKIIEIRRKYSLDELNAENQINIASTLKTAEARIDAETEAEKRIRDFRLADASLTETQRFAIVQASELKINELGEQRLQIIRERNLEEIALEQRKEDALFAVRKASVFNDDAGGQLAVRLDEINNSLIRESALKEQARQDDLLQSEIAANRELELLQFKKLNVEQQTAAINQINEEAKKRELQINQTYDAEILASLKSTKNAIQEEVNRANAERLQSEIDFKQLEIEAAGDPQSEFDKKIELLNLQEEAENLATQNRIDNLNSELVAEAILNSESDAKKVAEKEQLEKTLTLTHTKYNKLRAEVTRLTDEQNVQSLSNSLGQIAALLKQGSFEYKALAISKAFIDTYAGATAALAPPPTGAGPLYGPILAGATIVTGLANIAKITGIQFKDGGMTVEDMYKNYNPSFVGSFQSGGRYSKPSIGLIGEEGTELVISNKTLSQDPAFFNQIEKWNATGIKPFANGGFTTTLSNFYAPPIATPITFPNQVQQQSLEIDYTKLAEVFATAAGKINVYTSVREITDAQIGIQSTDARATVARV